MPDSMTCHTGARIVRCAAALLVAFATAVPAIARAQTSSGSAAAPMTSDTAVVRLAPARPTQGSVVQITLRVPPVRTDTTRGRSDSAMVAPSDTLRGRTGADSLRRDRVRADTLRFDSLTVDSLRADTLKVDSLKVDSLKVDSLGAASQPSASFAADSLRGRITAIRGTLFGEPLHFVAGDSGTWSAIGGIPVDAPRSVRLPLIVERVDAPADTIDATLEIGRTAYRMEKLTVAPRFGQAPDSALSARIAREQAMAAAVSKQSHATPRLWTGRFAHPRDARVTSRFGDGREFNGKVQSRHMGLDLAGAVGAPVLATERGVVALVGDFYYAGNAVYIDHGAGLVTAYFHLSKVNVAQGDTVAVGDTIGKVGATGRVTGPHLHWVARYGSVTVDPSTLLELGPARREP